MSLDFIKRLNDQLPANSGVFFLPFADPHIEAIKISQPEILVHEQWGDTVKSIQGQARLGVAVTGFLGFNPVICFGAISIWHGVSEAWMVADDIARTRPILMTKFGKIFADTLAISQKLHRIQITVRTTDKRAVKWASVIGFEQEGVMRKYGPDEIDYLLMARCK
jgi:hypothetical protein